MYKESLNGSWTMKVPGEDEELPVMIPGSVLSCLLDHKKIPDPFDQMNEYPTRELFWKDYEFSRNFMVTKEMLEQEQVELVCFGLDTITEISINDHYLASTENMHRTYRFSIKDQLKVGENKISVLCKSVLRYIQQIKPEPNKEILYSTIGTVEGNEYVRKPHCMFGWDWGPQTVDAGIFRDIQMECYTRARISDVAFTQKHNQNQVILSGKVSLEEGKNPVTVPTDNVLITLKSPEGNVLASAKGTEFAFTIDNPSLWWPNGLGEHPLYQVEVTLQGGQHVDHKEYQIGLRTIEVSQDKDQWGSEFAFKVNGIKIFAMGADYIPEDCIYSRITLKRQKYLIDSCVKAHFNSIRIWGGGYYPSDAFYDLCDRNGLLVWQDLMYACNVYDLTESFEQNIVAETIDNVKRLRHHASLAMWCGNNELESAWVQWGDYQKQTPYLRADYIKQFEYVLPKAVKQIDDQTFYWPSSPSSGGCFDNPSDENRGDMHYWDVWHGQKPFSDYQKYFFRFCSEFGFQSFPGIKTVKTYTREEDRNIFSAVMESHQKNNAANGKIMFYLAETFKNPKDFESMLYDSQILQAMAIKSGVEHWRRNRGRCMGTLYWQINDNWPVASWSSIDYFGRWKALHYFAKNFYAPIAGSLVKIEDSDSGMLFGKHFSSVEAHVQNETFQSQTVKATVTLKTMDFQILDQITKEIEVQPFTANKICERDYSNILQRQPNIGLPPEQWRDKSLISKQDVFIETIFTYEDGHTQTETETLLPYKHMNLPKADIHVEVVEETIDGKVGYTITLQSNTYAAFVELDFPNADAIFSDNYFNIASKEPVLIRLNQDDIWQGHFESASDLKKKLQIRSLTDTFK